ERHVDDARAHHGGSEVGRLLRRTALTVDGRRRDFERQAGGEPRRARDVERLLADLADASTDDLSDVSRVDARPFDRCSLRAAVCGVVLSLSGCGGDHKNTTPGATVHVNASTSVPSSSTSRSTPVTDVFPTTPLPCQAVPVPTTPVKSPAPSGPVLLTKVERTGDACVDHVIISFTSKTAQPPAY